MGGHSWEAGQLLAERYRLEERIGSGGMGEVWRAEHVKLRSPVAVKLLHGNVAGDELRSARFLREAQAAAAIRSSNVVQVLDYGVENGTPFIAMEYLEGETLADRLERRGKLSAGETARTLTQVARAVSRAHKRGIVHRDLKPSNIFMVAEEDSDVVKVLDFGIAKLVAAAHQRALDATTQTGAMLGTPHYMSPEQARGHKELDHRSDLWSLAVIAFECVTGQRPVTGTNLGDLVFKICGMPMPKPSSVAPVPMHFDAWFLRATQRNRDERFQSAKEMSQALREALLDDSDPDDAIDDTDSVDMLQPIDRRSIEMLETLHAKPIETTGEVSNDSIDSWDATPDPPAQKSTATPSGGSLARANVDKDPPPPRQRRTTLVVVGAVAAMVVALVWWMTERPDSAAHEPAPAASDAAPPETTEPPETSEPTASQAPPAASVAAPSASAKASAPLKPPVRVRRAPSATPSSAPKKIEFGI